MTGDIDSEGNELRVLHELVNFMARDVLEIGCGDGRLPRSAKDARAEGVVSVRDGRVDFERNLWVAGRRLRAIRRRRDSL